MVLPFNRAPRTTFNATNRGVNSTTMSSSRRVSVGFPQPPLRPIPTHQAVTNSATRMETTNDTNKNNNADPSFFACWGSSINVNEDLRRTIRSEIEDINTSMEASQAKRNSELQTSHQLDKELRFSQVEMSDISRSMGDTREVCKGREELRLRLGQVLESTGLLQQEETATEAQSLTQKSQIPTNDPTANDSTENSTNGTDKENHSSSRTTSKTNASCLAEMMETREALHKSIATWKKNNMLAMADLLYAEKQETMILDRIKKDGLEQTLETLKNEETEAETEKQAHVQSCRTKKEALQYTRARCGDYAQQIANHTKSLSAATSKNEETESESLKALQEIEASLALEVAKVDEYNDHEIIAGQLGRLQQDLDTATSIRHARSSKKLLHDEVQVQYKGLEAEDTKAREELKSAQVNLDGNKVSLKEAHAKMALIESTRQNNDRVQAEQNTAGQAALEKLLKEKEDLVNAMNGLHETFKVSESESDEALVDCESELAAIQKDLAQTQEEVQKLQGVRDQALEAVANEKNAAKQEMKELTSLTTNLELAIQAQQQAKDKLHNELVEERCKAIQNARSETEQKRAKVEALHAVILQGKDLLESTLETENVLGQVIEVSEDEPLLQDEPTL